MDPRTPASLGFRMPAEWEPHRATWLSWPYNAQTWEGDHLPAVEEIFAKIITELASVEVVHLLVPESETERRARKALGKIRSLHMENVSFHRIESGDVWIRDYGPIFVVRDSPDHKVGWTKWRYNAYGNKYNDLLVGDEVPNLMPLDAFPRFDAGIVLEGGSIDVNGTGSLLATESCLLSKDRNPLLTREEIETKLREFLGVTNILWLKNGIEGDDTTGHVDDLARFTDPKTVVTAIEEDPADENYPALRENLERLRGMRSEDGKELDVLELPMPHAFSIEGRRMAASYANFYIANGLVLVPTYGDHHDSVALSILRSCFPDRKVLGIDCRALIWGCGSIHCSTQQEPK